MVRVPRLAVGSLALAAALAFPTAALQAQPARAPAAAPAAQVLPAAPCGRLDVAPLVQIPVGKSTVIRPVTPIARVLLGNPENARAASPSAKPDGKVDEGVTRAASGNTRPGVADVDVLLLGPTEVYLLGKTIGSTNVVIIDRNGACTAFDVVVGMDITALQSAMQQLLPDEKDVQVSAAFDSVVLKGTVSDPEALVRVTDLTNAYLRAGEGGAGKNPRIVNMLQVAAPQQVMLEVKVAEVSRTMLDNLGISLNLNRIAGSVTWGIVTAQLQDVFGSIGAVNRKNGTSASIDGKYDDGAVKILAEPSIVSVSGQEGSFLAGGKVFIPVARTSQNGVSTISLEEKEFGVGLKFTPTVLGGSLINLRVAPEVSELSRTGSPFVTTSGATTVLPSFTTRRAQTTVQLRDGQSIAIAGLIKNNVTENVSRFPFLGELPVLGALFRSSEFQNDRSELVFVITPRLVKALPADYRLPTDNYVPSTRMERLLEGKLEGRPPEAPRSADGLELQLKGDRK